MTGLKFRIRVKMELECMSKSKEEVHEGYKPSEQNAKWAYEVVKKFVLKHYPKVL